MFLFFTFYRTLLFYNNVHIFAVVFALPFFFLLFFFFVNKITTLHVPRQIREAETGSCFIFTLKKSEFLGIKLGVTWRGQR